MSEKVIQKIEIEHTDDDEVNAVLFIKKALEELNYNQKLRIINYVKDRIENEKLNYQVMPNE